MLYDAEISIMLPKETTSMKKENFVLKPGNEMLKKEHLQQACPHSSSHG